MTREEAIKSWSEHSPFSVAEKVIDGFVALGMLKLDPPKSIEHRLHDAMMDGNTRCSIGWLFHVLDKAGLKLTEK